MKWNIQRKGRAWEKEEAWTKYELTPEKIEMFQGKIFWSDEQRLNMIGLLLENVGIDTMLDLLEDLSLLKDAIRDRENG
ncbi:MAG TPA: hypothetical protein PK079_22100 [Leptospiraceae bacterium]|nr:hypothetical protein [Leptospiraceae bacterium]HMW08308.1 hypothetical protein [Leptospiraceae bacterium]HMX33833.1 hypothetical protein [Leptospiraceae bacterium]HMY34185.1 hypothetical protein [Leptospiraceae bacterium]HMZ67063.1 hypothetical protein [Leptospiraceae bacterium]